MVNFKKKLRVDKTLAKTGVWTKIDDNGDEFGEYLIPFFDETSDRVRQSAKFMKTLERRNNTGDKEENQKRTAIEYTVTMCVLDWRGIEDVDGNEVPFSVEVAVEYFSDEDNRWILKEIESVAFNSTHYKTDEIEKNSESESNGSKAKK